MLMQKLKNSSVVWSRKESGNHILLIYYRSATNGHDAMILVIG